MDQLIWRKTQILDITDKSMSYTFRSIRVKDLSYLSNIILIERFAMSLPEDTFPQCTFYWPRIRLLAISSSEKAFLNLLIQVYTSKAKRRL